jgi:hypothetical protein
MAIFCTPEVIGKEFQFLAFTVLLSLSFTFTMKRQVVRTRKNAVIVKKFH